MFESLLARFLNKLLGDYIENLQHKQLEVAVWKGDVRLSNLSLQKNAFSHFNVPFTIDEGLLESLVLEIPWKSLKTDPIKVLIRGLKIRTNLKHDASIDEVEERVQIIREKLALVDAAEAYKSLLGAKSKTSESASTGENAGMMGNLLTRLINNVQITIQDIHILFTAEDRKRFPCELTVSLTELQISTTNENWRTEFHSEIKETVHKMLRLKEFSVALKNDGVTNFVVAPINAVGKASINRNFDIVNPKTNLELSFENIQFSLDDLQIGSILELVESFSLMKKRRTFYRFYPKEAPNVNPRSWWNYIIKNVSMRIKKRKKTFSVDEILKKRDMRINYIFIYKKILQKQPLASDEASRLEEFHYLLSSDDIILFRRLANKEIRQAKIKEIENTPKKKSIASYIPILNYFVSSEKSASSTSLDIEETEKVLGEIVKDDFDLFEGVPLFSDACKFKASLLLDCCSFWLCKRTNSSQVKLLDFSLRNVSLEGTIRTVDRIFTASISDLYLLSSFKEDVIFKYIIKGLDFESNLINVIVSYEPSKSRLIPLSIKMDFAPLQIVLNRQPIDDMLHFLKNKRYLDILDCLWDSYSPSVKENLKTISKAGLELTFNKKKSFNFDVVLRKSQILIPESIFDLQGFMNLFTFSSVVVRSRNFTKERAQFLKKYSSSQIKDDHLREIESNIYDFVDISIESLEMKYFSHMAAYFDGHDGVPFVEIADNRLNVEFGILVLPPGNYIYPRLQAKVNSSFMKILLSSEKYHALMATIDILLESTIEVAQVESSPNSKFSDLFSTNDSNAPKIFADLEAEELYNSVQSSPDKDQSNEDVFYDAPQEADSNALILAATGLFETANDVDVCSFELALTIDTVNINLSNEDLIFDADIIVNNVMSLKVRLMNDLIKVYVALPDYCIAMKTAGAPDGVLNFIKSDSLITVDVNYTSEKNPNFHILHGGIKTFVKVGIDNASIHVSTLSLRKILDFVLFTVDSENNPYITSVKSGKSSRTAVQVNASKTLISFLENNFKPAASLYVSSYQFDLNYLSPETLLKMTANAPLKILPAEGLLDIVLLEDLLMNIAIKAESVDINATIKNASVFLNPDPFIGFIRFVLNFVNSLSSTNESSTKEKSSSSKRFSFSMVFHLLSLNIPFNDNSALKIHLRKMQLDIDKGLISINLPSCKFLVDDFVVCADASFGVNIKSISERTRKIKVLFEKSLDLFFDENSYFVFLDRVLFAVEVVKRAFSDPTPKNNIALDSKIIANSISVILPRFSAKLIADTNFFGSISGDSLECRISHFESSEVYGELTVENFEGKNHLFAPTLGAKKDLCEALQLSFKMIPKGLEVSMHIYNCIIQCPLYFLMKIKQIFSNNGVYSLSKTYDVDRSQDLPPQPSFFGIFLVNAELRIEDSDKNSLIARIPDVSILKGESISLSVPTVEVLYTNSAVVRYPVLPSFSVTLTMETNDPSKQNISIEIDQIMINYFNLDILALKKLFIDVFMQPAYWNNVQPTLSKPEDLVSQRLDVLFKNIRIYFVDEFSPLLCVNIENSKLYITDWGRVAVQMSMGADINLNSVIFNIATSAWEPLIESWNCKLSLSNNEEGTSMIKVISESILDANFVSGYISRLLHLKSLASQPSLHWALRSISAMYTVKNFTRYSILLWSEKSPNVQFRIDNGEEKSIAFEESVDQILFNRKSGVDSVSMHILDSNWETLKKIFIIKNGFYVYSLRPQIKNVTHKLLVDIFVDNNQKIITLKSPFSLFNATGIDLEVKQINSNGTTETLSLLRSTLCPIKIENVTECKLSLRPLIEGKMFSFSPKFFSWRNVRNKDETLLLECTSPDDEYYFSVATSSPTLNDDYPLFTLNVNPPLFIHSLLPYDVEISLQDEKEKKKIKIPIERLSHISVHELNLANVTSMIMNISIDENTVISSDGTVIINPGTEKISVDDKIDFYYMSDRITICLDHENSITNGRVLYIYVPLLIYNRTDYLLYHSSTGGLFSDRVCSNRVIPANNIESPFLFSYPDEKDKTTDFSLDKQYWKGEIDLSVVGRRKKLRLRDANDGVSKNFVFDVTVGAGIYFKTTVIEILYQCTLFNMTKYDLHVSTDKQHISVLGVPSHKSIPFHFEEKESMSFKFSSEDSSWSFPIKLSAATQICVRATVDGVDRLINIEFQYRQSSTLDIYVKEESLWPYRFVNNTEYEVMFNQKKESSIYKIQPRDALNYCLDNPYDSPKILLTLGSSIVELFIGLDVREMTFKALIDRRESWFEVRITSKGPSFLIIINEKVIADIKDHSESSSILNTRPLNQAIVFYFKGVGCAFFNDDLEEFCYVRLSDINFTLNRFTAEDEIDLSIRWIQIDNQYIVSHAPICFCPSKLTIAASVNNPFFTFYVKRSKSEGFDLEYFDALKISIDPINLSFDENIVADFVLFYGGLEVSSAKKSVQANYFIDMDRMKPIQSQEAVSVQNMYIEMAEISTLNFNLKFEFTESNDNRLLEIIKSNFKLPFDALVKILAATNGAKYAMPQFSLKHSLLTKGMLVDRIKNFYRESLSVGKMSSLIVYSDILSVSDIIFKTKDGVAGFLGYVSPGENKSMGDIIPNLGSGGKVLVSQILSGVSSAISRTFKTFNKAIITTTGGFIDSKYQDRRMFELSRNASKGVSAGIGTGTRSFYKSLVSGITGVIEEPIESANEGISGVVKGLGRGVAGFFVKPFVGSFDFISHTFQGVQEGLDHSTKYEKMRFPKTCPYDGILNFYSLKEAYGQFLLRVVGDAAYLTAIYVAHVDIIASNQCCLLHSLGVVYIDVQSLRIEWEIQLEDIVYAKEMVDSIMIGVQEKSAHYNRFVIIPEEATKRWFCSLINDTFFDMNQRKKMYEVK